MLRLLERLLTTMRVSKEGTVKVCFLDAIRLTA